jgi:hypothetical protein
MNDHVWFISFGKHILEFMAFLKIHKLQNISNLLLLVDKDHQAVYFCMLSLSLKKNSLNEN